DWNNVLNTNIRKSHERGLKEGLEKGRMDAKKENARNLKKLGIATEVISQATGLSREEIEEL
ncbi:MAG: hypothetical protein K2I55_03630, partial [Phocaeicola sp.]|nr:hypothetical protein [Phocaeicola sp.]